MGVNPLLLDREFAICPEKYKRLEMEITLNHDLEASIKMSHYEFTVPRGSPTRNWCWIAIGVIGIILFIAGGLAYYFT
jgi:hypothetical protein